MAPRINHRTTSTGKAAAILLRWRGTASVDVARKRADRAKDESVKRYYRAVQSILGASVQTRSSH